MRPETMNYLKETPTQKTFNREVQSLDIQEIRFRRSNQKAVRLQWATMIGKQNYHEEVLYHIKL